MVRFQFRLTENQAVALRRLAAAQNVSLAALVRQAVDDQLRAASAVDLDDRKRRALAAVGQFHSGMLYLSAAHDKYLDTAYQ